MLDVRLVTDDSGRDTLFNSSPTTIGVALIILVREPSQQRPLLVDDCGPLLERLAVQGAPKRPGPKADQAPSSDAIRDALEKLRKTLNISRAYFDEDKRRDYYYLSGHLPEIRVVAGDRRHCGDWQSFKHVLWRVLEGHNLGVDENVKDMLFPPALTSKAKQRKERTKPAKSEAKPRTQPALPAPTPPKRKLNDVAQGEETQS